MVLAFAAALGSAAASSAEDKPLQSGPPPGERLPCLIRPIAVFDVQDATLCGKPVNYICRYAYEPMVLLFARTVNGNLTRLLQRLETEVEKRKAQRLRVVVVFLSDDRRAMIRAIDALAGQAKLTGVNLAVDAPESVSAYKLAKEADVTVLFCCGLPRFGIGKIAANYAYRKRELRDHDIDHIVADLGGLCLPIDPKAEHEALSALTVFEPIVTFDETKPGRPVEGIQFRANIGKVSDDDLRHLKQFPHLRSLDIPSKPLVTDAGLEHLAELTQLKELSLNWTKVTPAGAVRFVKDRTRLQRLELAGVKLDDEDLVELKGLTNLRALSLRATLVTDRGLEHLQGLGKLRSLSLMSTAVGDTGLRQLKAFPNLEYLDLDRTAITDAGLVHLQALRKLRGLQFAHTAVTDAGLEHLRALSNLESVNHRGTRVTTEGMDRLRLQLPKLK
jgi:hypothetical protein